MVHTGKITIPATGEVSVQVAAGVTARAWYLAWQEGKDKWNRQG